MEKVIIKNIFDCVQQNISDEEIFIPLYKSPSVYIEKIVSTGQITPENEWLEDERQEWVMLLKGKAGIKFADSDEFELHEGDYFLIPAFTKHRVTFTSTEPECIWLAFYYKSM